MTRPTSITFSLLVAIFSSVAAADLNKGLVQHLEWLQRGIRNGQQCVEGPRYEGVAPSADLAELCMSQICGPSESVTSSYELRDRLWPKNTDDRDVEALDAINSLLDEVGKEKQLTIQAYRDLQAKGDLTPKATHTSLHDLNAVILQLKRSSFQPGPDANRPVVVDIAATRDQLMDLPEKQRSWLVNSVDNFVRSRIGSELLLQGYNEPKDFLKLKYPHLSFAEALKVEGVATKKLTRALLQGPHGSLIRMLAGATESLTSPVIQKAAAGEEMTDAEVSEFIGIRSSASLFSDVLTPKEKGGQTVLIDQPGRESLADFLKRVGFDRQLDQYEADLKIPDKVKSSREAVYQSCYTAYFFQRDTLPDRAQIATAEKNAAWAKSKTKEVLGPILSKKSRQMLGGVIDRSFFSMPRSKESFHQYFIDQVKSSIKDSASVASDYQALIDGNNHKTVTLLNVHLSSAEYTLDQHFQDAENLCSKFGIEYTSDSAMTSTGGIKTSWVSVRKPEFGKAVMLHELGHIAHSSLDSESASAQSRARFAEIQQCLNRNHPETETSDRYSSGQYTDEDWSDLIAAKGTDKANLGCGLNPQYDDKYINLDLANSDSSDVHSSTFFRALHAYKIQHGKLPSACQQLLKSQDASRNFEVCF